MANRAPAAGLGNAGDDGLDVQLISTRIKGAGDGPQRRARAEWRLAGEVGFLGAGEAEHRLPDPLTAVIAMMG